MRAREGDYVADKGKYFVLTRKGKQEVMTFRFDEYEVGKPVSDNYYDQTHPYKWQVDNGYLEEVNDPDFVVGPGYKAVYDYAGHQICAGNPHVFFSREMAKRMCKHFNNRPWNRDTKAYVIEATYEGKRPKELRYHEGKPVYNEDWWFGDIGEVGDLVEWKIADYAGQCVPPKAYGSNFIQCGEPNDARLDDKTGKYRDTYSTFKRIAEDVWMYCGNCFVGEDTERGRELPYVPA